MEWPRISLRSIQATGYGRSASLARTLLEHVLGDRHGREDVGPADIEGEMRDRLRRLKLRQAVVHSDIQVTGQLRDLSIRHERADRHQTAIAWCQVRAQPQVPEQ